MANLNYRHVLTPLAFALGGLFLVEVALAAQVEPITDSTFSGHLSRKWGDRVSEATANTLHLYVEAQRFTRHNNTNTLERADVSPDGGTSVIEGLRVSKETPAIASLLGRVTLSSTDSSASTDEPGAIAGLSFFAVMFLIYHYTSRQPQS